MTRTKKSISSGYQYHHDKKVDQYSDHIRLIGFGKQIRSFVLVPDLVIRPQKYESFRKI